MDKKVNYSCTDITDELKEYLDVKGVVFNPSIAHLKNNDYIVSVRAFSNDKTADIDSTSNPHKNTQHPWSTGWKGVSTEKRQDVSYITPIRIENDEVTIIETDSWPIDIKGQDLRIFKFYQDEDVTSYVLTYNKLFKDDEIVLKDGDTCENWCYIIGWSYLVVNNDMTYSLLEGVEPLCTNISSRIDKNWSLWNMIDEESERIVPMISYMLTPEHISFSWKINGVVEDKIDGGYSCKLLTSVDTDSPNFFFKLQEYYDKNLFVSLSTPAYVNSNGEYTAVGHIKAKYSALKDNKKLSKFYKNADPDYLHPTFIYFMFFYRFKPEEVTDKEVLQINSTEVIIETITKQFIAPITEISPAFIVDEGVDYLLNFPSGIVQNRYNTIVSYGNGDSESKLLKISNKALNDFMVPVESLTPEDYVFRFL